MHRINRKGRHVKQGSLRPARKELEGLIPYDAKEVKADMLLSANENPLNLPKELQERIANHLDQFQFNRYPDGTAPRLRALIAEANGLDSDNVLIGNGGDELLMNMFLTWGGVGRKFMNFPPTFSMYENYAKITGTEVVSIPRDENFEIDQEATRKRLAQGDIDLIILASPNNPTGNLTDEAFLLELLGCSDALVCVDEAYFEFSRTTVRPYLDRYPNLVILRTFSKAFSLAALRVGYILADTQVIREFLKVRQPYSVSAFSQWVAQVVYRDRALFETSIEELVRGRAQIIEGLSAIEGVKVFPSDANYVMFRMDHASIVWRDLFYNYSIYIRDFSRAPGLEGCLRVTVGTESDNVAFIAAVREIVEREEARNV
ncbi:MAG: histidinol-phosphate transaminase [Coriobacteriia bacterium]|nr:histidinol-phosphate transaminase [Coriobacteriia bacterium]